MPAGYLAAEFLEISGYSRSAEVTYPYPHFSIPLPAVTDTDEWEFSTVHAVNFSTGFNQAEGSNLDGKFSFYGATTARKFYAGCNKNVITTSTYTVDDKPHTFSFQQKGMLSYASFDGQEIKLKDNSTTYPSVLGVFVALKTAAINFYHYPFNGKKYSWRLSINGTNVHNLIPALDAHGTPCMYDRVTKQPFYNSSTGSFIVGLTLSQAQQLSKLPVTEAGTLTLSLPWEAQLVITGVPAALQAAADKGWTITVQYRDPEADNAYYNKYAACATYADMVAVNPDFANDLTSDGEWVYPLPEVTATGNRPGEGWYTGWWAGSNLKKAVLTLPKCTSARCTFAQVKQEFDLDLELPIATYIADLGFQTTLLRKLRLIAPEATTCSRLTYWNWARQHDFYIYAPKAENMHDMFNYTPYLEEVKGEFGAEATNLDAMYTNCPKLRVFPTYYPKASTAANMFHNCQIPGQQAIEVLNSIPTWTDGASHPITIGIHVDYQNDTDVLTAITDAEDKGWTLTVQWNGTATAQTASTFGLRKPPIYAKLGSMQLPDGTTKPSLDWGHYVTNWEENGYQEFSSIEEANEYFNIESEIEQ